MRSARRGSLLIRARSLVDNALARASEKVVSSTRALGLARARKAARCSATMVLPVPAEPETRAGPLFDEGTLRGMEEDAPFLPGIIERAFEFVYVTHHAEAALRVGMFEGVDAGGQADGQIWFCADSEIEDSFGGFRGEVGGDGEDGVFVGRLYFVERGEGDAIG
jgi:hypothetical protein